MTQYKKGTLIFGKSKKTNSETTSIYLSENDYIMDCEKNLFHELFYELGERKQQDIIAYLNNLKKKLPLKTETEIRQEKTFTTEIAQLFSEISHPSSDIELIYEQFEDENNNLYGKELITGIIFPIAYFNYEYRHQIETNELYISKDKSFRMSESISDAFFDSEDSIFYAFETIERTRKLYERKQIYNRKSQFYDTGIELSAYPKKISHFTFKSFLCTNHDNLEGNGTLISETGVAIDLDIEEYRRKFNGFLGELKIKIWNKKLKEYAKANIYKNEIVPIKEVKSKEPILLEQDTYTKHMEIIEYLLMKLKKIDEYLYSKYLNEYNELLTEPKNNLTTKPLTLETLITLEANIEFCLYFGKNSSSKNILKDLEALKKEYLENILNNSNIKTKITLKDLDKISELFLNIKNNYTPQERREILKSIAFLYLMEVYENIDTITIEQLRSSYFKNNLKTIIMNIESLIELDLIKTSIYIDLNDEPSLENVYNIIKNIEFKSSNKNIKKLIKE